MRVGQSSVTTLEVFRLSHKDAQLLAEIGMDWGSTATSFVEHMCDRYEISRSGAWYCLKKLKKEGVVEFTEKGEDYKPLRMTDRGLEAFRAYVSEVREAERNNPLPSVQLARMF